MYLLFGLRKTSVMIGVKKKEIERKKKKKIKMKKEKKKKYRLMLLLMLMLWNNITSLHTAVKTISSLILAGNREKEILLRQTYRYI
jgi:hypothetical protein